MYLEDQKVLCFDEDAERFQVFLILTRSHHLPADPVLRARPYDSETGRHVHAGELIVPDPMILKQAGMYMQGSR